MSLIYNTKTFANIFETAESFVLAYKSSGIPAMIDDDNATLLYYLLYAQYGNSPIANNDEWQFRYKTFSIIFQYGPTWQKKLEIQNVLRNLSESELMLGAKSIYNHAFNPSTAPGTSTLDELEYINEQNTTLNKKNRLSAYAELLSLLETNVSGEFVGRFRPLFKQFVGAEYTYVYATEIEKEEDLEV